MLSSFLGRLARWFSQQLLGIATLLLTLGRRFSELPRNARQLLLLGLDSLWLPLALWGAHAFARGQWNWAFDASQVVIATVLVLASEYAFLRMGLYRAVVRYMGHQALLAILKGIALSMAFFAWASWCYSGKVHFLSLFLYGCLALLLVGGTRLAVRAWHQHRGASGSEPVVIYGAGSVGHQLMTALMYGRHYRVVSFVDDNVGLQGSVIHGVAVQSPQNLPAIVRQHEVSQILLAIPSLSRKRRQEILDQLLTLPVHVRTVPHFADLMHGTVAVDDVRDVEIEDLLGRDPVMPRPDLLDCCIAGKTVLVTGAGGSIGSELCRQILRARPKRLVLFEQSEYALYCIDAELRALCQQDEPVELVSLLGNVQQYQHLQRVLSVFGVDVLYHAAAYKHVPLVEFNTVEGIRNNVFGTYEAARAAVDAGVATFVLVSTDKAVRPANVMGASKWLAECVLRDFAREQEKTRFCTVRFGNVLGSSGSVIPLFRRQILQGGPVTVTHPDIIRYFMTAPEAAQLVLQASALAKGGEVFVLNMGEPVRIYDLACRMIRLMGHRVAHSKDADGKGIPIEIVGLRPGEKLYEELVLGDNIAVTEHAMIMQAHETVLAHEELQQCLVNLQAACERHDCDAIGIILDRVCSLPTALGKHDRVWSVLQEDVSETGSAKISPLRTRALHQRESAS